MCQKAIAKLTPKEMGMRVSENPKNIWEIISGVMAQAFPGIKESDMKSQSSASFPPIWVRQVSTTLIAPDLWRWLSFLWGLPSLPKGAGSSTYPISGPWYCTG